MALTVEKEPANLILKQTGFLELEGKIYSRHFQLSHSSLESSVPSTAVKIPDLFFSLQTWSNLDSHFLLLLHFSTEYAWKAWNEQL